jgi:Sulfotransferase family
MNNQAKHAVSNCGSDHRVHLILDYVDEDFHVNRRVQLQPGERLIQTRRSIDCLSDRGSRPTPTFLILGAQKAGTTSLYELIVQHPLAIRAKRRETHCLDWRWNEKAKTLKARRDHCLKFFHTKELEFHPSCLTGDSTPSYLLDSKRVIPRLKLVFPHPLRFFVMIRDPVARALSHYYMVTAEDGTPEQKQARGTEWQSLSFEDVIHKDLQHMKDVGLIPYFDLEKGEVDLKVWNSFSGSIAERQAWDRLLSDIPLNTGSHSLLARGLYELQLRPWFQFFPRERFLILQLEDFRKVGLGKIMNQVWDHLGLPQYTVVDESAKNSRSYPPMSSETKLYLERFYAPHNRKLKEVIEVEGWSYST